MYKRQFVTALILTVCVAVTLVQLQNERISKISQTDNETAQINPQSLTEPLTKLDQLTADLQQRIDRLDAIVQEYERITQEHYSMSAQLRDFAEVMDEVGRKAQERYMKGR